MLKNCILRDFFFRLFVLKFECQKRLLKFLFYCVAKLFFFCYLTKKRKQKLFRLFLVFIQELPKNSNFCTVKNRCVFTGRSKSILKFFRLSRIQFKLFVSKSFLCGVKKVVW